MPDKNESSEYSPFVRPLQQVVSIPNPLYKSLKGIYFIGQTPSLFISDSSNAWAALVNPRKPNKDLFVQEDGKLIIPSDGDFLLFLKSSSSEIINARIAYGWWEE